MDDSNVDVCAELWKERIGGAKWSPVELCRIRRMPA
jgi:hypothetical protein